MTASLARLVAAVSVLALLGLAPVSAGAHEVDGTLSEEHGDRFDAPPSVTNYSVATPRGDRALAGPQSRSLVGQRVTAAGTERHGEVVGRARAADDQRLAPAPPAGPQSVLVILVTTPDAPTAAASVDQARGAVFTDEGSANALFRQQSEGATSLTGLENTDGDVAGPVRIDHALTGCDYDAIGNEAKAAAAADGWSPERYDHVMYILPDTQECDFGGLGELPGDETWINGYPTTRVTAHELGHNMGAHHANTFECGDDFGNRVSLSGSCSSTEYGDDFDVMGLRPRLMSSWHRYQIGQLAPGRIRSLTASDGTFMTSADDFGVGGTQLLMIPRKEAGKPVSSWFAVETRSPSGPFDGWDEPTDGLFVRVVNDVTQYDQSQLLDGRPETGTSSDAALPVGSTISDDAHGISITSSLADGQLVADVTMPTLRDDVAPSAPSNVVASGDRSRVRVSWSAATDDTSVDHYEIERNGAIIGTTKALTFDDTRLGSLQSARYRVFAVDPSANRTASDAYTLSIPNSGGSGGGGGSTGGGGGSAGGGPTGTGSSSSSVSSTSSSSSSSSSGSDTDDSESSSGDAGRPTIAVRANATEGHGRRRRMVLRLRVEDATSVKAKVRGRQVAKSTGRRLTVKLKVARAKKKRTVQVVARGPGGTTTRTFTLRKPR